MKIKEILIVLLLICVCAVAVSAQKIEEMPMITVTGTAEVEVAPDTVILSLDVTKLDKDLATAKRLNDESVTKILELTRRLEIPTTNVQTDSVSVEEKNQFIRNGKNRIVDDEGDEIGKKVFLGYEVEKTIVIKLTDITKFENLFNEVLKTGLTEINSVRFETSKPRENKDKARDLAMKAAKEKAIALAGSINQTIGKALRITEENSVQNYGYNVNGASVNNTVAVNFSTSAVTSESIATFSAGTIKIQAQVTVSFLLN